MKIKRIFFGASLSLLGLATLASCGEEANTLTYTDANGETQTLKVSKTDDSNAALEALTAVTKSYDAETIAENYKNVTGAKLSVKLNANAGLKETQTSEYGTENHEVSVKGSASLNAIVDTKNGTASASVNVDGNVKYSGQETYGEETESESFDVTANAEANAYFDNSGVYLDAKADITGLTAEQVGEAAVALPLLKNGIKYSLSTEALTSLASSMFEIPAASLGEYLDLTQYTDMIPGVPALLAGELSDLIPTEGDELEELKAFAEKFGLAISDTSANTITFQIGVSMADFMAYTVMSDYAANPFENYTTPITLDLTFNTKYYLPTAIKVDASKALKKLAGNEIVMTSEYGTDKITFSGDKLSLEAKLEVGNITAKTLKDSAKAEYTDASALISSMLGTRS